MVLITTQVEINASPEHCREIFLDWPSYPSWSAHQIKTITPLSSPDKAPKDASPGDTLGIELMNTSFKASVLENSPQAFTWRGSLPYIFTGDHSFRFLASETTPGSTKFVHEEQFSGLLSPLVLVMDVKKGFQGFCEDLKKKCEEGK